MQTKIQTKYRKIQKNIEIIQRNMEKRLEPREETSCWETFKTSCVDSVANARLSSARVRPSLDAAPTKKSVWFKNELMVPLEVFCNEVNAESAQVTSTANTTAATMNRKRKKTSMLQEYGKIQKTYIEKMHRNT